MPSARLYYGPEEDSAKAESWELRVSMLLFEKCKPLVFLPAGPIEGSFLSTIIHPWSLPLFPFESRKWEEEQESGQEGTNESLSPSPT